MSQKKIVEIGGPGLVRGSAYGEQARSLVEEGAARWREHIARGLRVDIDEYPGHTLYSVVRETTADPVLHLTAGSPDALPTRQSFEVTRR